MNDDNSSQEIECSPELAELPDFMRALVAKLVRIHGPGRISHEDHGRHLNVASPKCLEEDGLIELNPGKRHLSINLDKYFRLGQFAPVVDGKRKSKSRVIDTCALCMKTNTSYKVSSLLVMDTVEKRGYKVKDRKVTKQAPAHLIDDGKGNLIPDHPGKVTPIVLLPKTHPAREYLESRGFTAAEAYAFCRLSYCYEAAPEGEIYGRFYRRMAGGTRSTNSERVVFYIDMEGVQRGWQARYLEKTETHADGSQSLWHWLRQYANPPEWSEVARRASPDEAWEYRPDLATEDFAYSPDKYRNAGGQARNEVIMGLDAAISWNRTRGLNRQDKLTQDWEAPTSCELPPLCVLVEGPTDALRLFGAGAPACAIMGRHFSDAQADIVARHFGRVLVVRDNDKAGAEMLAKVRDKLSVRGIDVRECTISDTVLRSDGKPVKDPGDMTREQAQVFVAGLLDNYNLLKPNV